MRWADRHARRRPGAARLTGRRWAGVAGFAGIAVSVAVGIGPIEDRGTVPAARIASAQAALAKTAVIAGRPPHDSGYDRDSFGTAWTDRSDARGAGNGCDTRNDILSRDVEVSGRVAIASCPGAVAAGTMTSPYTGRPVVFERGRKSAAVQIDHIVPLSYAWDMGARSWTSLRRIAFANDPSNLVAVDGSSNQAKSDAEPARWMPPLRDFHCQYAVQFALVLHRYGLPVDAPSRGVLADALSRC
ncbi:HNH endonuclease family protein [Gordonia zhaorongruii]|uniref:HNH endonuclease family protein n=1 Tax=Gordonia zhaorongruii TaxID=2597659 RepID=UPI00104815B7|nr:HNH endonuclease family protein [Gordonia zhaorongruii]